MSKTTFTKKKQIKMAIFCVLLVLLISVALLLLSLWEQRYGRFAVQDVYETTSTVEYNGQEYVLKDDVEAVLVMGLDKFDGVNDGSAYNNDKQADFLLVLVVDNNKKECSAIQVNRDAMTEMNVLGLAGEPVGTVTKQVALAHTYGNGREVSCRNTVDAVSGLLLDIKVKHYISFTMDSVPVLNDLVEGVELEILDDFSGIDDELVKGEVVTLRGEHALNYVRTRYGLDDSSNSSRMIRQRQYLEALYNKAIMCAETDETFVVDASFALSDFIVSDRSVTQLQDLFEKLSTYKFTGIKYLDGENVHGEKYIEFYPDDVSIWETVLELFYELKK